MSVTNNTTNAIITFLNVSGHMAWRNSTVGTFDPTTKRMRTAHPTARGTADIVCCLKGGQYFEIEIKTGKDRMSPQQEKHRGDVLASGGIYIVARTYDDFRIQYDNIMKGMHNGKVAE